MSKFQVGDRVRWTVEGDRPVIATVVTIGDDPKYADLSEFHYDYQLVLDEEYVDDATKFLYALSEALLGEALYEAANEDELELIEE